MNPTTLDRLQNWLDRLAPCLCSLCGMPSRRHLALCQRCEREIPRNWPACSQCALPLPLDEGTCGNCLRAPPPFSRALAPCLYTEPVSGLIQGLKFRRDFAALPVLIELMAGAVEERLLAAELPDALVPMPMHWWRRLRRGFNQAELIASGLCAHPRLRAWELSVNLQLCRRQRATPPQLGLDAAARRKNLVAAIICPQALNGMKLAVIDDVMTTGASAQATAKALLAAGASEVEIWCCARTPIPPGGGAKRG